MARIRVAVLGATGVAGQEFLAALPGHPWFEVVRLGASERSSGRPYAQALRDASGKMNWFPRTPLDAELAKITVENASDMRSDDLDLVFTAVESDAALKLEPRFAEHIPVISTASAFRDAADVPIALPGVTTDQLRLIDVQRQKRGWRGFIVPGPNCTAVGLAMTLKPLHAAFGVERVMMTSLQSVSGAGRTPGVLALDIIDNVIPYIAKEEEKVETETRKLLGHFDGKSIVPANIAISCTCTRVNVLEGHTECVSVGLSRKASLSEVKAVLEQFGAELQALRLPSSPTQLITVSDDPYRPQPRLDRDQQNGMVTSVGRLREDPVLGGVKYVLVSHNTRMGAARGALLTAEELHHLGYLNR